MRKDLAETSTALGGAIEALASRGEKLSDLESRSAALLESSVAMSREVEATVSGGCRWWTRAAGYVIALLGGVFCVSGRRRLLAVQDV